MRFPRPGDVDGTLIEATVVDLDQVADDDVAAGVGHDEAGHAPLINQANCQAPMLRKCWPALLAATGHCLICAQEPRRLVDWWWW